MEEDWADAKDGGLGNEWLVSRYISLTGLHHQSSFALSFLGPSVFFFVCLFLILVFIHWHSSIFSCPLPRQTDKDKAPGLRWFRKHEVDSGDRKPSDKNCKPKLLSHQKRDKELQCEMERNVNWIWNHSFSMTAFQSFVIRVNRQMLQGQELCSLFYWSNTLSVMSYREFFKWPQNSHAIGIETIALPKSWN